MSIKNQTHVVLTNPNDRYEPYTSSTPQPTVARLQGYTDVANNASQKNILVDSDGHLQVDIVSGGGGGGDATAANQTTMISHLSDIDTAVTGTLNVADSAARSDLSTIAGAVSASEMQVSDSTAQGSLSTIAAAVTSGGVPALSFVQTSDTTAQSSLSVLAGAVAGTEMQVDIVSAPTLNVSDSTAQGSLSTLAGAVAGSELQVDIVSAPTLNVSDSAAQSSLSTLAGAVAGSEMQVDVVSSALPSGAATSALQSTGNASLATIAGDSTSIDGKISQGADATLASAQQVLCYGRDNGGTLDALRTDAAGHLEVVVDDFVKGQTTMTTSFPVVIASDQSDVNTKLATVANYGTHGNMINGSTLNFGSDTTAVDVQYMNRTNLFYEDTATASMDSLDILGSIDGSNYYNLGQLYPTLNSAGTKREASYSSLFLDGLKYLKLRNTSSTDNYTAATGTICGTPS